MEASINLIGISGRKQSGKDTIANIIQELTVEKRMGFSGLLDKEVEFVGNPTWQIKKFGGPLKQVLSILTGIPVEDFEKEEVKNSFLGEEWDRWVVAPNPKDTIAVQIIRPKYFITEEEAMKYWESAYNELVIPTLQKITVRQALQWIGTDLFRDKFHPNTWVNALMKDYKPIHKVLDDDIFADHDANNTFPKWLISDVRFPNEVKAIKDRGGIIIRVNRPLYRYELHVHDGYIDKQIETHHWVSVEDPGNFMAFNAKVWSKEDSYKELMKAHNEEFPQHESETALDAYEFDYVIENDGSIEDLVEKVKVMLLHYKML